MAVISCEGASLGAGALQAGLAPRALDGPLHWIS